MDIKHSHASNSNNILQSNDERWSIFWQSNKIVLVPPVKAMFLISNDWVLRECFFFPPICLLSVCILKPLLSLDIHGSSKCRGIQGSFHVAVTLLQPPYTGAQQTLTLPFQALLSGQGAWCPFALCGSVYSHIFHLLRVMGGHNKLQSQSKAHLIVWGYIYLVIWKEIGFKQLRLERLD